MYMQARYYDPVIGRFYSNDPVGVLEHLGKPNGFQGFNRYSYAINNPYKYTDPDGEAWSWAAAGVGTIAGAVGGAVSSIVKQSFSDEPISWGQVAGDAAGGAASGFIAGAVVGAFTGDPTAAGAALLIVGSAAGGVASGEIGALTEVLTETDLSEPQFQGRYSVEELEQRESQTTGGENLKEPEVNE